MTMALEGITVLDWTIWQQGPVSTVILADLGADVIKIEHRVTGDPGRGMKYIMGAMLGEELPFNTYFEGQNRNKRGITLDMTKDKGREVLYRLVKKADVIVSNFRHGITAKLKADYETLSQINPRLIYAVASGLGPEGPNASDPCLDAIGQARSGIMHTINWPGEPPRQNQIGIGDQVGAIHLALGVLAAIVAREKTGKGQKVEVSLLGGMCWLQQVYITLHINANNRLDLPRREDQSNPIYNHYCCSDGTWIMFAMLQSDRYWADFCRVIGREDLVTDARCANMFTRGEHCTDLVAEFDRIFKTKTRAEWMKILKDGGDFIFGPVNDLYDLVTDPQVLANKYITDFEHPACGPVKIVGPPFHFSETPASVRRPAPEFGQHTEEVLIELGGYTWEEIETLRIEEVI